MRFEWKDEYLSGDKTIDEQHKQIFDAANVLFGAVKSGKEDKVLDQYFDLLLRYTNTHFDEEEAFYQSIGSTMLAHQRDEHRQLVDELREMWRERRQGGEHLGFDLEYWVERRLLPHITDADQAAQAARTR